MWHLPRLTLGRKHTADIPETTRSWPLKKQPVKTYLCAAAACAIAPGTAAPRKWTWCSGPFADAHLEGFETPELDRLEALMDEEDTDLLKWVMGQEPVPTDADAALLSTIIAYRLKTQ